MSLGAGVRVGPYEILAPLGAGGMGEVYRARDERLGRDIALKILSTDLSAGAEHLRRFDQEARAASALNHPNIITIYDIGRVDTMAYIAMELIEGRDVRSMLAGEPVPLKQALRIAVKVADGLAAAHERGIVHRDLKPENVMVSRDGYVKILDFGLAKLVRPFTDKDTTLPHTTPGAVFGTVGYMSPEQAAARDVDFRSDQFALGVILYEMVTGRLPFSERTAAETLAAIIRTDPPPVTHYNEEVSPDLVRIIDRCLAKDPADRYSSTRDLVRDLREIRDRVSNTSQPRHRSSGRTVVLPRSTAWVSAAIVVLLAIGAGMMIVGRKGRVVPPETVVSTVAILPFTDQTGTAGGRVFADGLAEIITSRLGGSDLRIIGMFGGSAIPPGMDPYRAARDRGARAAITGEVDRQGDKMRITYSVIDTGSGRRMGGSTVEGTGDLAQLAPTILESIHSSLGLPHDTRQAARGAIDLRPEDQQHYIEAVGLLQRALDEKSVDRAVEILQRLLLNARESALVNAQLARALLYKSQLSRHPELIEQATIYAERAAELDGSDPEVRVRLGHLRLEGGRYDEAEREFRRALALSVDDPDATLGLAVAHEKLGRAAEAEKMYVKALSLRPDHGGTYNRYAVFLFYAGRYEEAAANFRRFTELTPTARGFSNLGEAYRSLGRYDDAQRAHLESIALEQTTDGYTGLGHVYYYTGRHTEARQAYQTAVALSPTNYEAWIGLGHAFRSSGSARDRWIDAYEKGLSAARGAIAINSRDSIAQAMAAIALAKLGRPDEAAAASTAALRIDPTDKIARYAAAVVAVARGAPNSALTWLDSAVRAGYPVSDLLRDPDFESIRSDPAFRRALQQQR
ncbi:MAG TPA: protein kinase [Thermoanaerobaculia bacterium]|nr:protein kinase [Thermoanaerobaculia bacterium]